MEYTIYATAVNSIQRVEANRVVNLVDFNLFDILHEARSNKHDKRITKALIRLRIQTRPRRHYRPILSDRIDQNCLQRLPADDKIKRHFVLKGIVM